MQTKVGNANLVLRPPQHPDDGMRLSALLMATGFESMSEGHVWAIQKAAEYLQMAHNYRRQFEAGRELDKIKNTQNHAPADAAGRPRRGCALLAMPSEISPQLRMRGQPPCISQPMIPYSPAGPAVRDLKTGRQHSSVLSQQVHGRMAE